MPGETFGQKMLHIREEQGLTRYALAKLCGLTQEGLARLEKEDRDPNWHTVQVVAVALSRSRSGLGSRCEGAEGAER